MQTNIINQYFKKLIIFNKIYKDKDKFSDIRDKFNFKVTIFYNKYRQIRLLSNINIYDLFIILSSQIQTYYYINCGNIAIFNQFYINI